MRTFVIIAITFLAIAANAQTKNPPKIRLQSGFLTSKWEIGDKNVSEKEVLLHLEKHNSEAYYKFRRGRAQGRSAVVWSLVGLTGALVSASGAANDNPTTSIVGSSIIVVGCVGTAVCLLGSSAKKDRAVKIYNTAAGY